MITEFFGSKPEAKKFLEGVRELLHEPESWTQNLMASNSEGEHKSVFDDTATCWCLMGAFIKAGPQDFDIYMRTLQAFMQATHPRWHKANLADFSLVGWNDAKKRTHAQVIETLDKAIEFLS